MVPRIITDTSVTVHLNGDVLVANSGHPAFAQIRQAALKQDWDAVSELVNVGKAVETWSEGQFSIKDNAVYFNDQRIPDVIERRILGFLEEKAPFKHLLAFYLRLRQNPSRRSVETLYSFLEHENIPIGDDGYFYAYKSVRSNWMDHYSGRCFNGVGTTLAMPRNEVDDDPARGCSYGYHVGSLNYASSFGSHDSRLLIVKVDPANVVAVPHDCAFQKVRTSEYTVYQEYRGPLPSTYWDAGVSDFDYHPDSDEASDIEDEIDNVSREYEEQLDGLQRALDAVHDAGITNSDVVNGLVNQISQVEAEMNRELQSLSQRLFEIQS